MKHHLFSNEDLGIWFDHYNERCFGGKLPKVRAFFGEQVPLISPGSGRLVLGYLGPEGIVISREIQFSQCLC